MRPFQSMLAGWCAQCSNVSVLPFKTIGSHTAGKDMSRYNSIGLNKVYYCNYFYDYFPLITLFLSLFFIILTLKLSVCCVYALLGI